MNKLSIVAVLVIGASFLEVYFVRPLSYVPYATYIILALPVVSLVLGALALKQMARTRQKGKIVAWAAIAVSALKIAAMVFFTVQNYLA